jgi:23S rRNA (adenine2030-N6)-methyltransferase
LIAKYFLRAQDKAWLYELHPRDFQLLEANIAHDRRVRIYDQDGFSGLLALLPPVSRRGLILIDPSYEVKVDYERVYEITSKAYKKFSTGIYVVWYPVVSRDKIDRLEKKFIKSGINNIQRFEVGIDQDSDTRGMTSSGMFVINPPWRLFGKMATILPRLSKSLSTADNALFRCDVLVAE